MIEARKPDIVVVKRRNCLLWEIKKVVITIVVGALGTITTKSEEYIESLGIEMRIECLEISIVRNS